MKYLGVPYEAFGEHGPYIREARVIHELPTPGLRFKAVADATVKIGNLIKLPPKRIIPFGEPVYVAYGMTQPEAKKHPLAALLLTQGCDVPLARCI